MKRRKKRRMKEKKKDKKKGFTKYINAREYLFIEAILAADKTIIPEVLQLKTITGDKYYGEVTYVEYPNTYEDMDEQTRYSLYGNKINDLITRPPQVGYSARRFTLLQHCRRSGDSGCAVD